jgi:hypothetical protein
MPTWDMILFLSFWWKYPFPGFILSDKHNMKGFDLKGLYMDLYSSVFSYIFIAVILILISWSYIKISKTNGSDYYDFFPVDIIIHCFMRFGLHTSYIYGGHFVFVYPLLLDGFFMHTDHHQKHVVFNTITVYYWFIY